MKRTAKGFYILLMLAIVSGARMKAGDTKPCPTNKIAPHRRITSSENRVQHRTFGLFDTNQNQNFPLRDPPRYDLDDCGDIEDYDENDLSSLISPVKRQEGPGRLFFNYFNNHLPQQQQQRPSSNYQPQQRPPNNYYQPHYRPPNNQQQQQVIFGQNSQGQQGQRPQAPRPVRPTNYPPPRPQFASGDHHRRPPQQNFSNNVKPVYEGNPYFDELPTTYRPNLVGGPIGHVVGVHLSRPPSSTRRTITNNDYKVQENTPPYINSFSISENPRNNDYSQTILGSFIDLLFR